MTKAELYAMLELLSSHGFKILSIDTETQCVVVSYRLERPGDDG